MSFEERNNAWDGRKRRFVQPHSRSAPREWSILVGGNHVRTWWGQVDGKLQIANEYFQGVNEGRANYMPPEVYALDRAREMCRKKVWEGYREMDGDVYLDPIAETVIDFSKPLPLSLSFYKPDNTLSPGLEKKAREGQAWFTRKRNGMMKVLCKGYDGELKIYSRRMLRQHDDETNTEFTWDDRFPFIIGAIEPHIPPGTILLGELVVEEFLGNDPQYGHGLYRERFDLAQSYIKSLTPKAVADMESSGLLPFFYCWDIAFWEGENWLSTKKTKDRYKKIGQLSEKIKGHFEPIYIIHPGNKPTIEGSIAMAKQYGWEGFVVVDPDGVYGDKAFNFKGKPDRPAKFCGKLKPSYEDDFIAIWDPENGYGERSRKGSRAGGIKSVGLYQYNANGKLVFVANVSSGLTKEMLAYLPHSTWPVVWKVEYKGRRYISDGDDTNALDFPAFVALRTDKSPQECVNEKL